MTNLIAKYPSDLATKDRLSLELLNYFNTIQVSPNSRFDTRFKFLLNYFELHGDEDLKFTCTAWKEDT